MADLKVVIFLQFLMSSGRAFHKLGAATENALAPYFLVTSWLWFMFVAKAGGFSANFIRYVNFQFLSSASCPDGWEKFSNSCYVAVTNLTAQMSEARAGCHRLGAELVDILSKKENAFVHQYARKMLKKTYIWLGLQRDERRLFNKWFSGKTLGFQNWFYGEPNDYDNNEGCALMYIGKYRSGWNDVPCYFDHKPSFVCKKPKQ